jgi:hypothetical protein
VTFTSGNGTTQNPYTIDYCLQLQAMQNNTSAAYQLGRDIDCSDTIQWNSGAGFRTIGYDWNHRFFGSFDGNYKLITGLTINRPSTDFVALFGRTSGGVTLKNVGFVDVSITGRGYVGALLGQNNMSRSYVSNAWSTGQIIGNGDRSGLSGSMGGGIGGLIGHAEVISIDNCSSSAIVGCLDCASLGAGAPTGGLVGHAKYSTYISYSHATGNVSGGYRVGGLVGTGERDSIISDSYATGSVTANGVAGGLVGEGWINLTILSSYATGDITSSWGDSHIGGLIAYGNGITIRDSYATGNVNGNGTTPTTGGLIGRLFTCCGTSRIATIESSYAVGHVQGGSNNVGGLIGAIYNNATITNSYWNTETTSQLTSSGSDPSAGLTTGQMQQQLSFTGFDFTTKWSIESNRNTGYPFLRNLPPPTDTPTPTPTPTVTPTSTSMPTETAIYTATYTSAETPTSISTPIPSTTAPQTTTETETSLPITIPTTTPIKHITLQLLQSGIVRNHQAILLVKMSSNQDSNNIRPIATDNIEITCISRTRFNHFRVETDTAGKAKITIAQVKRGTNCRARSKGDRSMRAISNKLTLK